MQCRRYGSEQADFRNAVASDDMFGGGSTSNTGALQRVFDRPPAEGGGSAVGGGGTAFAYMLMGLYWTVNNILCLIAMTFMVWMGSMIGYSKIIETIQQFRIWQSSVNNGVNVSRGVYNNVNSNVG